ncbi:unnamed protein product [Periconia digitata]|uniref:DNA-directed RNA polymerase III subunit RPC6 n=1 Tax=Periconia digitata TaxID=1303443 RepID=A0A9W4XRJ5_9PLEO|nr:unnamed protein product [Periconia digitata]
MLRLDINKKFEPLRSCVGMHKKLHDHYNFQIIFEMATEPSASATPVKQENGVASAAGTASRFDQLYDKCATSPPGTVFFQRDLSALQVADTMEELLGLINGLCAQHLLKQLLFDNEPCWKLRDRREAEKLRTLTPDEHVLYQHIDQAQNEGVWSKALRAKTNFAQPTLTKCLKSLESKDLVQSIMSVKFPARKMYLLKYLTPSEDIAGGLWQNNGDFDMAMIDELSNAARQKIEELTCVRVPAKWNNYQRSERAAAIAHKKAHVLGLRDIEDGAPVRPYKLPVHGSSTRLVYKSNPTYPTATTMAAWLNGTDVLKGKVARDVDMEQLLEMMVLDGRLEKASAISYRTALNINDTKTLNGFVDAPCGTCPVFDLCADDGDISARTCVYFGEWLGTESEEIY